MRFRLNDLVLMMGEDEINPTGVNIDGLAEELATHG
jgi:hypothetical protein